MREYDFVVIGSGPAGTTAALMAARRKAQVALVEAGQLGGVSLHLGCVPVKSLVVSARMLHQAQHAEDFGIHLPPVHASLPDWINRQRAVMAKLAEELDRQLQENHIDLIRGHARFTGPQTVAVHPNNGASPFELQGQRIIIATGARPAPFPPLAGDPDPAVIGGSNQFIHTTQAPKHLLIVGGSYIGCEFANIFLSLGSQVTLVTAHPRLLFGMDAEASLLLHRRFEAQGVRLLAGTEVTRLEARDGQALATLASGDTITAPRALIATGRVPNYENLELGRAGLPSDHPPQVNEHLQTLVPHVYAVGDVNGRTALAHSAAAQARVAVGHALGENVRMDFSLIPVCVYTQPEITSVGLTEEEARAGGRQVLTGSCPMRSVGRAVAMGELEGFVKLVADAETGRILGGVIAGGQASELIAALTVALKLGATARDLAAVPFAHPTLSEAIAKAARQLLARRLLWL